MADLVFEKITQTLAASQRVPVQIAGNFFRMSVAPYAVAVSLVLNSRIIGTMQNLLAGDYVKDIEFDGIIIQNGAMAQDVSFQIAGGGAGSDRVLGEVSVINGELAKVKAGGCFGGVAGMSANAGQYSFVQLWNPVASGKTLILNKVSSYQNVGTCAVNVSAYATMGVNFAGNGTSKKIGGAVSSGELRTGGSAVVIGQAIGQYVFFNANDSKEFSFSEPLVIPQGSGVIAIGVQVKTHRSLRRCSGTRKPSK